MANNHIKICSMSLIEKLQIKTTMSYHFTHYLWNKQVLVRIWKKEIRKSVRCWQECKMAQQLWKQYMILPKNKQNNHMSQQFHFRVCTTPNLVLNRCLYGRVHSSIVHNSQKTETTQMSINWWTSKQNGVHTFNGMLFSLRKGANADMQQVWTLEDIMLTEISQAQKIHTVWFRLHEGSLHSQILRHRK